MTDIAIEQAPSFGSCVIGMKPLGASALLKELQRKSGSEPDPVVTLAKDLPGRNQRSHASAVV